jgi:hypothetical protein
MSRPAQILAKHRADTTLQVGGGVICDTPQVERYLSLNIEGKSGGCGRPKCQLEAQNPFACGLGLIAFVLNEAVEKVPTNNDAGWQRIPPTVQYMAVFEKSVEI